jgi:uncharacterized RDD family membrane protein YckC
MDNKEITVGSRIGAMFLDHIVMCFIIAIFALPIMSLEFKKAFGENPSNPKESIDWMMFVIIFGMSLYLNKDMIQGKSIAKRALKQEVIDIKNEQVASSLKCLIRNITIFVWPIEVIVVLINPSRRLGDLIARTRVGYITGERDSKPKVDFKNLFISLLLGFFLVYIPFLFFSGKFGTGAFDKPDYVETSYNKRLSSVMEQHIDSVMSDYLLNVNIRVYDTVINDSLKYIAANFLFNQNYMENDLNFKLIKDEIFNSMFEIVPKKEFILFGKFMYDGKTSKQSTWRTYDWRKIE